MATITCQNCDRPNPDNLEICQYCGTPLKNRNTEPLPTIHPGEVPVKQQTSDLENTLPTWLRDMRKGDTDPNVPPGLKQQTNPAATTQPSRPAEPPKQKPPAMDFLAGLSQLNDDDEEAEPDWMSSLKGSMPSAPATPPPAASPQQPQEPIDWTAGLTTGSPSTPSALPDQPVDWLAGFQTDSQPQPSQPDQPSNAWGGFDDLADEPSAAPAEETPDWLSALKAQDTSLNTPSRPAADDFSTPSDPMSGDFPDWLSSLGGEPASTTANSQSFSSPSFSEEPASDLGGTPDWLSDLSQSTPPARSAPEPVREETSGGLSDFPDWLGNLGGDSTPVSQTPTSPAAPEQNSGSLSDFPDWLSGLGGESAPAAQTPASPAASAPAQDADSFGESLDWLSGLSSESAPAAQVPASPAASAPAQDADAFGESLDWLSGLSSESAPAAQTPASPIASVPAQDADSFGESLDWLSGLSSESAPAAQTPVSPVASAPAQQDADAFGESIDWLSGLSSESAPVPQTPVSPVASEDQPDAGSLGEFPDWLSGLGSESAAVPEKPEPQSVAPLPGMSQEPEPAGDFPDWLSNLNMDSTPAAQKPEPVPASSAPAADSAAADEFPDWLSNLNVDSTPVAQTSQAATQPPTEDEFSGWLSGLEGEAPAAPAETPSTPAAPVAETPSESGGASSIFDNLMINSDIGWLDTPTEKKPEPETPTPSVPVQKAFRTGSLEGLTPFKQNDDEVPDWLANLNATAPKKPQESAPVGDFASSDAFDWMSGADQGGTASPITESKPTGQPAPEAEKTKAPAELPTSAFLPDSSQNLDSIFSMEMPDWLSGFTPSESGEAPGQPASSEQPSQPLGDRLSPADLPSWVQAMRPIESMVGGAQGVDDQTVEQEGPLAGLRSVLPGQTNAPVVRRPKTYAIKLQVDSAQLAQATLLENLIASEAESRPVVTAKRVVNIRPLRWVIAVILLLVVLIPGILGTHIFSLPDAANEETSSFYNIVDGLPADIARVLIVFDYQPGYAGEMEHAAGPVLSHLLLKNARLAFVSTIPTGVLVSERIMDRVDPDTNPDPLVQSRRYKKGVQYIDLGYLPGDAAGIQVFAENPNMLGNDYQEGNLWQKVGGLSEINNTLSNFDAAIVLTDNPDTGRMWIEQASPALATKPLLMVVSAQAAPMIFPYAESGQVKGLVSGLTGGALYEQMMQLPPKDRVSYYFWDSYGFGMIAAELVIVFGAVWALVARLRARRAEQNREEDEE